MESGGGAAEGRGKSAWEIRGKIGISVGKSWNIIYQLNWRYKKRGLMGCSWNLKKDNGDFMGFYQDDAPVSQDLVETCWLKHTWLRGSTLCEVPEGRKDEQSIYKKWNIQTRNRKMWDNHLQSTNPIGSMYALYIYGNIYHQYTPNVSIYTSTMDPMGIDKIWWA